MRYPRFISLLLLCMAGLPSCRGGRSQNDVIVAGSTSIQPFADKWAEVFMEKRSDLGVSVQGGGSSAGIQACKSGACQIGMSSRELKADEKDLHEIVIARDGLAIIVQPSNPVRGATLAQVKQIFSGDLTNWEFLGGPDKEITVVTREEGSGTRGAFQELVMGKTRIFRGAITEDSNGTVRESSPTIPIPSASSRSASSTSRSGRCPSTASRAVRPASGPAGTSSSGRSFF